MSRSVLEKICCVTLFTYLGVLTRLTLSTLWSTSNVLLPNFFSSFFLANIFGCFVMGVFIPLNSVFYPNYKAWYVGVTTGYCGCCTTFSTWQKVAADMFANGRFVDGLMTLVLTFCTSYMAFIFGKHIGEVVCTYIKSKEGDLAPNMAEDSVPSGKSICRCGILLLITCLVTAILWIGIFLDTSTEYRRNWWVAVALGPIGSLLRYWLILQNWNFQRFPYFTFVINVSASVSSTVVLVLKNANINDEYLKWFDVWINYGFGAGIFGCFSTVSTFVNELLTLSNKNIFYAYRYGLLSVVTAQILCITIVYAKFL